MTELESTRLDKWLWAARLFKTRQLAAEAIAGGKVHVNNQRAKPGKEIKRGFLISVSKESLKWLVTVKSLSRQRKSAAEAASMYEEDAETQQRREQEISLRREQKALYAQNGAPQKPNKKERRLIHRFKQSDFG